jgi:YidC/Oxa1 family membrane protein insertase
VNEDRRNFVAFLVIAALILIGWQAVQQRFFPAAPPATKVVNGKSQPLPKPAADPTADSPVATRSRAQVLASTPRVTIDTPALAGSINLVGARIDDLVLKRHTESLQKNAPPIRLLSPAGAPNAYFAQLGWRGGPGARAGRCWHRVGPCGWRRRVRRASASASICRSIATICSPCARRC